MHSNVLEGTWKRSCLTILLAAASLAALGSPAGAISVAVFYSGGAGYTGPFSGAGTVYSATTGTAVSTCTGTCTPVVNGDIIRTPITFNNGITASTASPAVWFDLTPAFGGSGLQTASGPAGTGDDQIEGTGILNLHFASAVTLTGVATLFDSPHDDFGTGISVAGVGSRKFFILRRLALYSYHRSLLF